MLEILFLAVIVGAGAGAVFSIRSDAKKTRRTVSLIAVHAVLISLGAFVYTTVGLNTASLSFFQRVDVVTPWIRAGLCLSLAAFVMSLFAVRRARLCLVVASLTISFIWLEAAMAAV
jgi:hypothetical protein